jgi:hypothetical protein
MKGTNLIKQMSRRRVLRGMLGSCAVTVGLPLLDCFLDSNATALASGDPMPVRFGTWFWGLGMDEKVFVPKTLGANYELPEEIAALAPVRDHVNLFTNFNAFRDASPNLCHYTGWVISRTGVAPASNDDRPGETIDVTLARKISRSTRFQNLTATATGDVRNSFSYEDANTPNSAEASPLQFYTRLFGPDFQDPNAATFIPNPRLMLRKSVLSGITDQSGSLMKAVDAADRARLDQYFTNVRDMERQLDQQLQKPTPIAACVRPAPPKEDPKPGVDTVLVGQRHQIMTDMLVMAIACDQTRVFNMAYSTAQAATSKTGYEKPHHTDTHEEAVDQALGYQPINSWFIRQSMASWAYFVEAFTRVKEGDGTLLDNVLIFGTTDHSLARVHSLDGVPMFTAGRAGGRIKSGLHIDGGGTAGTRVGYTIMKTFGIESETWGTQSNKTSQTVSEMLT